MGERASSSVEIAGVRLTSPDRLLYEEAGFTKRDLAAYYEAVAPRMLPHVAGRPLTLLRCPAGRGACFFQRHPGRAIPKAVRQVAIAEKDDPDAVSLVIEDLSGLIALVQIGTLEIHPWGARADDPDRPDRIVFDLDPDPGIGFAPVVAAAQELRAHLDALGLASFAKTSGGKGLHVTVPIRRRYGWDEVKAFARALAGRMAEAAPDRYTTNPLKEARGGRIFIDYLRNDRGNTAVAPYSPRARAGAPVATPLAWAEVTPALDPVAFTIATVPDRLAALRADPWSEMAELQQSLSARARRGVGLA